MASRWERVELGDLIEVVSGGAFSSEGFNEMGNGLPLVRIRDLTEQSPTTYYSGQYDERFVLRGGEFLVGMDGEFSVHEWRGGDALMNQRVCAVRSASEELDSRYLRFLLEPNLRSIENRTTKTTVKHLSVKDIRRIMADLPPIIEQRRIADLMSHVDHVLDRLIDSKETVSRVFSTLRGELLAGSQEPGWNRVNLGGVAELRSGSTPKAKADEYWKNGSVPFLKIGDLTDGSIRTTESRVTEQAIVDYRLKVYEPGTLVFALYGATIGKFGILEIELVGNQAILAISPDSSKVTPRFLLHVLGENQATLREAGFGAAQKNLSKKFMNQWEFDLPPLSEQQHIADTLDRVAAVAERLENQISTTQRLRDGLLSTLLSGTHKVPERYDRLLEEVV